MINKPIQLRQFIKTTCTMQYYNQLVTLCGKNAALSNVGVHNRNVQGQRVGDTAVSKKKKRRKGKGKVEIEETD